MSGRRIHTAVCMDCYNTGTISEIKNHKCGGIAARTKKRGLEFDHPWVEEAEEIPEDVWDAIQKWK
jgi:ribosomal protein L40E